MSRRGFGKRIKLKKSTPEEIHEMNLFLEHIQKYRLFDGWTLHLDLYLCYIVDFKAYHPDVFSDLKRREFSLRLIHILGLKKQRQRFEGLRRYPEDGSKLTSCRTNFYFIPSVVNRPANCSRIAA